MPPSITDRSGPVSRGAIVLVVLMSLGLCSIATAQDLSQEEIQKFQKLMGEGAQAYENEEYERSIELLARAREIYDHPDLLYNIGRAHTRLRQCREARRAFITYLQRPEITDEDDRKARKNLEELSECVEPARIAVTCTPDGAAVDLDDGEKTGVCPVEFEVEPGQHQIAVSADDFVTAREIRRVDEGGSIDVDITLEAKPTSPPAAPPKTEGEGAGWQPIAGWSLLGGGVAMLTTGIILDSTSVGRARRLQDAAESGDEATVSDLERRAGTIRVATIVMYGAGLVAAATGSGILIWGTSSDDETAAGATVTFRF